MTKQIHPELAITAEAYGPGRITRYHARHHPEGWYVYDAFRESTAWIGTTPLCGLAEQEARDYETALNQ